MIAILALALAGGLVLNVMPCVLPVLALKAFSVVDHSRHDASLRRKHGIAYALGTMTLFLALASLVLAVRASGRSLGWGMQFQHPPFVATMTAVVFTFALNALGVFEITLGGSGAQGDDDRFAGSFVNGLFAALMSTPCSAPFLGTAVAFALGGTAAPWQTLLVFGLIGLGLALPYLLLMLVPSLAKLLPRPGAWMEWVKQVMGFALMGTAIWLFRTLQAQLKPESSNSFLGFLLVLSVVLWAGARFGGVAAPPVRRWLVRFVQVAGLAIGGWCFVSFVKPERIAQAQPVALAPAEVRAGAPAAGSEYVREGHIVWAPYDAARLKAEAAQGRPVFMDFTAEWCASCKVNEAAFIETADVRAAFVKNDVLPMRADMTEENEELTKLQTDLGRSGIPIYVLMLPDGTRDLLPITITTGMVVEHLDQAGQKFPASKRPKARL